MKKAMALFNYINAPEAALDTPPAHFFAGNFESCIGCLCAADMCPHAERRGQERSSDGRRRAAAPLFFFALLFWLRIIHAECGKAACAAHSGGRARPGGRRSAVLPGRTEKQENELCIIYKCILENKKRNFKTFSRENCICFAFLMICSCNF